MLKITSYEEENGYSFDIEDETEDFDVMHAELSTLLRYAYDAMFESASQSGVKDPAREAQLYIDSVVNEAINGDITETSARDADPRTPVEIRDYLHLVDEKMNAKKDPED